MVGESRRRAWEMEKLHPDQAENRLVLNKAMAQSLHFYRGGVCVCLDPMSHTAQETK